MNFKHKNSLMISPNLHILKFLVPILYLCVQFFFIFWHNLFKNSITSVGFIKNLRDLEAEDGLKISDCLDFHL